MIKTQNWLLLGPEAGQKSDFLTDLKAKLAHELGSAPEEHKFYAFETEISDLLSLLQNGSLFSSHKLVLLHNAEAVKAGDAKLLAGYLKAPSPDATLVLTSDETKLDTLAKALPKDNVKVFWEMFESQKRGWVLNHFRTLGLTIDGDAADFFLEMVENTTDQLRLEAQKLLNFFEKGNTLTLDDLETYLSHSKEENVFTLFEQIAEGDFPRALEVLHKILASKESEGIGLLGGLVWQFKNLLGFQVKLLERMPPEEAFAALKVFSKKQQSTYNKGARRYTLRDLQNILTLTAEWDFRLRGFRTEYQGLLMELYLYHVILKKGALPEPAVEAW